MLQLRKHGKGWLLFCLNFTHDQISPFNKLHFVWINRPDFLFFSQSAASSLCIVSSQKSGEWKYTPSFTDIMPEILEESAEAVCGAGWVRVWRPLLCVIGSARPVSFPMHLHLRCLPQLPSVWKERRLEERLGENQEARDEKVFRIRLRQNLNH